MTYEYNDVSVVDLQTSHAHQIDVYAANTASAGIMFVYAAYTASAGIMLVKIIFSPSKAGSFTYSVINPFYPSLNINQPPKYVVLCSCSTI